MCNSCVLIDPLNHKCTVFLCDYLAHFFLITHYLMNFRLVLNHQWIIFAFWLFLTFLQTHSSSFDLPDMLPKLRLYLCFLTTLKMCPASPSLLYGFAFEQLVNESVNAQNKDQNQRGWCCRPEAPFNKLRAQWQESGTVSFFRGRSDTQVRGGFAHLDWMPC